MTDAAVYALNTPKLWDATPAKKNPALNRETIDPRKAGNFERYFLQDDNEIVWTGEPTEMDKRLVAQSGTVVVPGILNKSLDEILSKYRDNDALLKKIVFAATHTRRSDESALPDEYHQCDAVS
ncbi:hypothetical protein ACFS07_15020 [Undibacterium arcticum]